MRSFTPILPLLSLSTTLLLSPMLFSSTTDWHQQLQDCLEKNQCAIKQTKTPDCCLQCLGSLNLTGYSHLKAFLSQHPGLACTNDKTTVTSTHQSNQSSTHTSSTSTAAGHKALKGHYLFSLLIGGWWQSAHVAQNCNRDTLWLNVNLDVFQTNQHQLFSQQVDGSMVFKPLKRCPRTMYGGVKTLSGPKVRLMGQYDHQHYRIQLQFQDTSTFFYTNGKSYDTGDFLNTIGIIKETKGVNVKGTLSQFSATSTMLKPDSQLQFDTPKSSSNMLWWSGNVNIFIYQRKGAPDKSSR